MAEHDHDDGDAMGSDPGGLGSDGNGGIQGGQIGGDFGAPSGPNSSASANSVADESGNWQDAEQSAVQSPLQEHMNFKTSFGLDDGRPTTWTGNPDYRAVGMPGGGYYSPSDSVAGARTTPGSFGSSQAGFTPPNSYGISWTPTGGVNAPASFTPSFNRYADRPTNWAGVPDFQGINLPGGGYYSPSPGVQFSGNGLTQNSTALTSPVNSFMSPIFDPLSFINKSREIRDKYINVKDNTTRHASASYDLTKEYGPFWSWAVGTGNEWRGLVSNDLPDYENILNGTKKDWAFSQADFAANELGRQNAVYDMEHPDNPIGPTGIRPWSGEEVKDAFD